MSRGWQRLVVQYGRDSASPLGCIVIQRHAQPKTMPPHLRVLPRQQVAERLAVVLPAWEKDAWVGVRSWQTAAGGQQAPGPAVGSHPAVGAAGRAGRAGGRAGVFLPEGLEDDSACGGIHAHGKRLGAEQNLHSRTVGQKGALALLKPLAEVPHPRSGPPPCTPGLGAVAPGLWHCI